jgi:hypothetical protein
MQEASVASPTSDAASGNAGGSTPGWLVPALIALVLALIVAVVVLFMTRDGDDEATTSTEVPPTSVPVTSDVPTTVPETTVPESTVPETTVAETTVPETVPPTTGPPLTSVTPGQAIAVVDGATRTFTVANTCQDFWVGIDRTSHVLLDDASGAVWVVDVLAFEEGGPRAMIATDMSWSIASGVFGQDTPGRSPTWSASIDESTPGVLLATLDLEAGDGAASIDVAIGDPTTPADCAVGSFEVPSPFAGGTQVEWRSADETIGNRFSVLGECGGELVLSGGTLLVSSPPSDGGFMATALIGTWFLSGQDVDWFNVDGTDPTEYWFEMGGGGDALPAINVFREGDRATEPAYLQWTERPAASAVGAAGLVEIPCSA